MPFYDYACDTCETTQEIFHLMADDEKRLCSKCNKAMRKILGCGRAIIHDSNSKTSREIAARQEKAKEIKNKPVARTHSGTGSGRGRAIGGQHMEIDRADFIRAASKDDLMVDVAQKALKKSSEK